MRHHTYPAPHAVVARALVLNPPRQDMLPAAVLLALVAGLLASAMGWQLGGLFLNLLGMAA